MDRDLVKLSRFLSRVLRHDPGRIGLTLDAQGWADVDLLIGLAQAAGQPIDLARVLEIVAQNDKQRFALSTDGRRIRANQGHTVDIDLGLDAMSPPERLFHGTADRNLASIGMSGLDRGRRRHVHLSSEAVAANKVGARHGRPVVLEIASSRMHQDGHVFYCSANGVWLTEHVPVRYIRFPAKGGVTPDRATR